MKLLIKKTEQQFWHSEAVPVIWEGSITGGGGGGVGWDIAILKGFFLGGKANLICCGELAPSLYPSGTAIANIGKASTCHTES